MIIRRMLAKWFGMSSLPLNVTLNVNKVKSIKIDDYLVY